ncbi:hypothetical protein Voc01_041730 [Virgisporangium ochraceum]|uniref:Uncharacterized protein n=1 Tax=Virgisporangium ochraceum TaxID=65505 RepID=A0A8J3ZT85_9ACTN|nr:hypothetical protein Voc01_041730 [Virgisporangium ochraceum]
MRARSAAEPNHDRKWWDFSAVVAVPEQQKVATTFDHQLTRHRTIAFRARRAGHPSSILQLWSHLKHDMSAHRCGHNCKIDAQRDVHHGGERCGAIRTMTTTETLPGRPAHTRVT